MKYAIFGDIHANLEAFQGVLEDAEASNCTDFVCVGDIVGYAADPNECLRIVREMDCPVVKGNHDEEAILETSLEGLNPLARQAMEWTRAQLNSDEREYLANLKLVRLFASMKSIHS